MEREAEERYLGERGRTWKEGSKTTLPQKWRCLGHVCEQRVKRRAERGIGCVWKN